MKKLIWILGAVLALGMGFFGCSDDGGSESGKKSEDSPVDVVLPVYKDGKILRNKVVMLDESNDAYYEYFKFSSETDGEYALYKGDVTSGNGEKQSSFNGKTLPSAFAYEKATGKITVGDTSSYIYSYKSSSDDIFGVAREILVDTDETKNGTTLYTTWKNASGMKFAISKDEDNYKCEISKDNNKAEYDFGISDGAFKVAEIPFFWTKLNGKNILYYLAYETERLEVSEVGRNVAIENEIIDVALGKFIFANLEAE